MGFVVIPLDGRVLDGAVHPLGLSVGPGMIGLSQPMFNPVFCTYAVERVAAEPGGRARSVFWQIGELDSIVGEHDLDPVGHGGGEGLQEGARGLCISLVDELSDSKLGGAVDRYVEIELALRGLHFGDVDMKLADRIGLELALGRSFAFDLRQAGDPMTLKAAMQRRARQARDRRLQCVKAVVERRQSMPSERNDDGLFLS